MGIRLRSGWLLWAYVLLAANATNTNSNTTYLWTGPNGFSSNGANTIISNVSSANNGAYTVSVNFPNGCSTTESIVVNSIENVPAQQQVSSNSPICEGENIILFTLEQ